MAEHRQFAFGRFRFDTRTGELWHDRTRGEADAARGRGAATADRASAATRHQAGAVRQRLGRIAVSDDALTSCIQELRGALGDDARRPTYIETRHRRGYRLMVPGDADAAELAAAPPCCRPSLAAGRAAGRTCEVAQLRFVAGAPGRRQVVFVTGEPGIGKSVAGRQLPGCAGRPAASGSRTANASTITASASRICR